MTDRKEYIERGALIQKITEKFQSHYSESCYQFIHDFFRCVIRQINKVPTTDVVEVVRCEKCKFYEIVEYWHPDCNGTKQVCRLLKRQMQEDDFCSYGERKDGADNAAD